jgi:hypothetical protein
MPFMDLHSDTHDTPGLREWFAWYKCVAKRLVQSEVLSTLNPPVSNSTHRRFAKNFGENSKENS